MIEKTDSIIRQETRNMDLWGGVSKLLQVDLLLLPFVFKVLAKQISP